MKQLNKVKVDSTFRITAGSALEAAKLSVEDECKINLAVVIGDDMVFVTFRSLGSSKYYFAVIVDFISPGKYRVEIGDCKINEAEYLYVTSGDSAVNEVGFYRSKKGSDVTFVNSKEYDNEVALWTQVDLDNGKEGDMVSFIEKMHTKVTMINGEFHPADT